MSPVQFFESIETEIQEKNATLARHPISKGGELKIFYQQIVTEYPLAADSAIKIKADEVLAKLHSL